MTYDHCQPGERVSWPTLNGTASGIVEENGDRGVLVRMDGGGIMILGTEHSIRYAAKDRERRIEAMIKKHLNLSNK